MTDSQRRLFTKMLDLNWEIHYGDQAMKATNQMEYLATEQELIQDMGIGHYKILMMQGRKMFATK